MSRPLIALTGPARSGKDTAAQILVEDYGFTQVAFADKLKEGLLALNPYIVDPQLVSQYAALSDIIDRHGWETAKDLYPDVRRLLQRYGSEAGWMIHGPKLWPKALATTIAKLPATTPVVISDLRFPIEQKWVQKQGGIIVAIQRRKHPNTLDKNATHISERGIANPDYTLLNNTSIDNLRQRIQEMMLQH